MHEACTQLECGNQPFKLDLVYPVQTKVHRPICLNNKKAESDCSASTCDVRWNYCPATAKVCVRDNFKERILVPVSFHVKRPKCAKNVKKGGKSTKSKK